MMNEAPKKIEVVNGNGKDLQISEVSTHLQIAKPKMKNAKEKKQEIVIPQVKKNTATK